MADMAERTAGEDESNREPGCSCRSSGHLLNADKNKKKPNNKKKCLYRQEKTVKSRTLITLDLYYWDID